MKKLLILFFIAGMANAQSETNVKQRLFGIGTINGTPVYALTPMVVTNQTYNNIFPKFTPTPTFTPTSTFTNTSTFTATKTPSSVGWPGTSPTDTPTNTYTSTPTYTWTVGPLSDAIPVPQNAWVYTTGGEATLPSGTVSSSQHFLTITGSAYRTIAITRIRLAFQYDNVANTTINTSQPIQFSIRNPDSGPSTHFVNPSISKLDINAPASNAAITFNYTSPSTPGTNLGASEYAFCKAQPVYDVTWSTIFPVTTPTTSGLASLRNWSVAPIVWDDNNGRAPFIVRGASQNFCISIPSGWSLTGGGGNTYIDYDVEWMEY